VSQSKFKEFWAHTTSGDRIAIGALFLNAILVLATACLVIATKSLVTESSENPKKQLRAYVIADAPIVDGIEITNLKPINVLTVRFGLINTGQTPAERVRARLAIDLKPYPLNSDMPLQAEIIGTALLGRDMPLGDIRSRVTPSPQPSPHWEEGD
jgi:hypothetical protein